MFIEYSLSVGHCTLSTQTELPTTRAPKHQVHLFLVETTAKTMTMI